jgi:two-component system nitrogen regulation sensor histidine kinase NtrY
MAGSPDPSPWALSPEVRRRRREVALIAGIIVAVVLLAIFQFRLPSSLGAGSLGTDAVLIALIDLNLILLVLLVFLVGRNIAKLIFERRRRIMGSHLRTRLVVAFVAIALLPATLLFLVALVFVQNSIERWFNGQVESSLEGSLDVAHAYYEDLAGTALGFARQVATGASAENLLARHDALKRFLDERRAEYQLDMVEVFSRGQAIVRSRRPDLPGRIAIEPRADLIRRAAAGEEGTLVDPVGGADMIRAAVPIQVEGRTVGAVVIGSYVPKSVVKRREESERAFNEYLRLKIQRRPIQTNYIITLAVVTIVVLFSATWFGFYLARGITVPIQRLAEGTRAVAQGDLDHRIEGEGEDEVGTLVRAFNRMTAELKTSRAELESRRRYLETVLANVTAGVVSADAEGRVTTMNRAAASLLGMKTDAAVGRPIDDVFAGDEYADVRQLAGQLRGADVVPAALRGGPALRSLYGASGPVERQITLSRDGQELAVLLTGTRLPSEGGGPRGLVLFFEEVTHLLRVQRMEAWREVARRIAHEIKNPLTPIQLSAQRLRRRYAARLGGDGAVFDECTRTIIQQVEDLKALVNEFSTFARMPAGAHTPQDLNRLVEETLVLFREGHREIAFAFEPEADLPELELDREGMKRALINLLDNAVAACAEMARRHPGASEPGRVALRTAHDTRVGVVRLEIADNGAGMAPEVKARLFEPYFSTKPDGTGLGLAIVSAIVADHDGFIRVRDNLPRGSRFVMELPVRRRAVQLAARAQHGAYAGARS